VYDVQTKQRLIPNYTFLPCKHSSAPCVDIEFMTPACGNRYVQISIGVLFTSPQVGDQCLIERMAVHHIQRIPFPPEPSYTGASNAHETYPYRPSNAISSSSSSNDDHNSNSDSDDDTPPHSSSVYVPPPPRNTQDPYYTYDVPNVPYAPPPATTDAAPVTSSYTPPRPIQHPLSIKDLQESLNSMIGKLDTYSA
jgi:hypothetical protein